MSLSSQKLITGTKETHPVALPFPCSESSTQRNLRKFRRTASELGKSSAIIKSAFMEPRTSSAWSIRPKIENSLLGVPFRAALWLAEKRSADPYFQGIIPVDVFFSDLKATKASV